MKKFTILKTAAAHWKNLSQIADTQWQISEYLGTGLKDHMMKGTIIKYPERTLIKGVPEYRTLEKKLEAGVYFDPTPFLPPVPLKQQEKISRIRYIECGGADVRLSLPWYFANWFKGGKKVFNLLNANAIEFVDPVETNYFPCLPSGVFLLTVKNDAQFLCTTTDTFCAYTHLLISRDDSVLKIFMIPDDTEKYLFTKELNAEIVHIFDQFKSNKNKKNVQRLSNAFNTKIGTWFDHQGSYWVLQYDVGTGELLSPDLKNLTWLKVDTVREVRSHPEQTQEETLALFAESRSIWGLGFFMNGLGKLLAEHDPEDYEYDSILEIENDTTSKELQVSLPKNKETPLVEWCDVEAKNITTVSDARKVVVGGKKDSHRRMPTIRKYADGREIFVPPSAVNRPPLLSWEYQQMIASWKKHNPTKIHVYEVYLKHHGLKE